MSFSFSVDAMPAKVAVVISMTSWSHWSSGVSICCDLFVSGTGFAAAAMSGPELASMVAAPALLPSRPVAVLVGVPMMSASAVDMCRGDSRPSCCWPLDPRGEDGRRTLPSDLGMTQAWTTGGTSTSVRHNAAESSENAAVGSEEVDGRWRRRVMMKVVLLPGRT